MKDPGCLDNWGKRWIYSTSTGIALFLSTTRFTSIFCKTFGQAS